MTKFEVGKYYAIGITHLSKTLYKCISRTDKTVTFMYLDGPKRFKIKHDNRGETFFSYPLWADSYGKQENEERLD